MMNPFHFSHLNLGAIIAPFRFQAIPPKDISPTRPAYSPVVVLATGLPHGDEQEDEKDRLKKKK